MTKIQKIIMSTLAGGLMAGTLWAAPNDQDNGIMRRDKTYEQNLRWEASDDKTITPSRVIRWMRGARGAAIFATVSPAEFQPIVNVQNSRVRAVATIAYKF
jgi:hypothetical protein